MVRTYDTWMPSPWVWPSGSGPDALALLADGISRL
jgi:hypothetical protein